MYWETGIKTLSSTVVIALCCLLISDDLQHNLANKGFDNNEVIEISYSENISAKLAEANNSLVLKPIDEKDLEIWKTVKEVSDKKEEEPVVEQTPVEEVEQQQQQPVQTYEVPTLTGATGSEKGNQIAQFAAQFAGNPYVYGGTSLTNGADCSGFVQAIYSSFGISIPRTATAQSYAGTGVSVESIQPGDLVFYGYGSIDHVALYIGNGQVIHAMNPYQGIQITSYSYGTPIVGATRVL